MLALTFLLVPAQEASGRLYVPPRVEVVQQDGRSWFTVEAESGSVLRILEELAAASGRDLRGLEALERTALVTVKLERRPLHHVLEYVLGSVGLGYELSRSMLRITAESVASDSQTRLERAAAAWLRIAARFPDHPEAAVARLAQGEIAELRGLATAARDHYLTLIEDYPHSDLIGEAYMRAGRLSSQLGQWAEASRNFQTLAALDVAEHYHSTARLEWARTMVRLGDPQAALNMIVSLNTNMPTEDPTERTGRVLVKARALNARELYMEALRELDGLDRDYDTLGAREALEIRAVALDGVGLPSESSRAWMLFAENAEGVDRSFAFERAAQLALEANDELAVIFIVRRAEALEVDANLAQYEEEARRRLGFEDDGAASNGSIFERLKNAEYLIERDQVARALPTFESLFLARGVLDDETAARVTVGWARCVESTQGVQAAIPILSEVRATLTSMEARRTLDLGAAVLFEKNELYEHAIGAYEGRY